MRMPKSTTVLIFVLFLLMVLMGYNYFARPFGTDDQSQMAAVEQNQVSDSASLSQEEANRRWHLADLTPEQRVGQLLVVPITLNDTAASDAAALAPWLALEPAGVLLFGDDISVLQTKAFVGEMRQQTPPDNIPLFLSVDHEGGTVQRLNGDGFTLLPSAQSLCKESPEEQLTQFDQSAQELQSAGVSLVFGPAIDVASSSAILKSRVCSGDPEVVSQYGEHFVSAFLNHDVVPVLKHYPGIGSITRDLHTRFDQQEILTKDVIPFRTILDVHPQIGVMSSHLGIINQRPLVPCSLSADCIDQLKNTNPTTFVVSDALSMKAAAYDQETNEYDRSLADITISAIVAGNQLLIYDDVTPEELAAIKQALVARYQSDETFAQIVDAAAQRVLDLKEYQLFK